MLAINLNEKILYYKAGEFTAKSGWIHKEMYHDQDFELIFCLEHTLSLLINDEPILLKKNDCLVIPPHSTIKGAQRSSDFVHFYWVHFFATYHDISDTDPLINELTISSSHHEINPIANAYCLLPTLIHLKEPNFLIILINQLLNVTNTYYYNTRIADMLVQSLLIELCNQYLTSQTFTIQKEHSTKLQPIADWIRANMSSDLTIQMIADAFEVSPDYLSRQFKKEKGQNLRDYLIDLKISVAKVLLIQTTLPIKAIAELSYYPDEKYFIRIFKKKTGLTPNKYRISYTGKHLNNPYVDPKLPVPQQVEQYLSSLND